MSAPVCRVCGLPVEKPGACSMCVRAAAVLDAAIHDVSEDELRDRLAKVEKYVADEEAGDPDERDEGEHG